MVAAATEIAAPLVPTTATALALTIDLLEVLEEVDPETCLRAYEPALLQLSSPSAAIRSQVCCRIAFPLLSS